MRKSLFTFLFFIAVSYYLNAQNIIYRGNTSYKSTETWSFNINGTSWGNGILEVNIGKNGLNGMIMLQTEVTPDSYIGGNIYIFLSDGTKITCIDKKKRDFLDNKSIVIYDLTSSEINKMKDYDITSIRFTIQPASHGGFNGNKTADNITTKFTFENKKSEIKKELEFITSKQIRDLFDY